MNFKQIIKFSTGVSGLFISSAFAYLAPNTNDAPQYSKNEYYWASKFANSNNEEQVANSVFNDVKSKTSNFITGGIQNNLAQFGTVDMGIDFDDSFSISSGHFDILVPFKMSRSSAVFVQPGLLKTKGGIHGDRTFAHIGVGYRLHGYSEMYGINKFIDMDMGRGHKRGSFGAEYWNDTVKLSGNYYYAISSWKGSTDEVKGLTGQISERPAGGYDVRVEGKLPQAKRVTLGATYEKYNGNHVGLDGRKSPEQYTVDLTYQPMSLLRLVGNYNKGLIDGLGASVNMNYMIGVPMRRQLSPSRVSNPSSLAYQMMHSMVDRNHNITLEYSSYRPPSPVRTKMAEVAIFQGKTQNLSELFVVSTAVDTFTFSGTASAYISNIVTGGDGTSNSSEPKITDYTVQAPTYIVGNGQNGNRYNLIITANLANGQQIISNELWIYSGGGINDDNTIAHMSLNNSINSTSVYNELEIVLRDGLNNIMPNETITLQVTGNAYFWPNATEVTTNSSGEARVRVYNTTVEEVDITLLHEGVNRIIKSEWVDNSGDLSNDYSFINIITDNAVNNYSAKNSVQVILKNINNKPVRNQRITFVVDKNARFANGSQTNYVYTDSFGRASVDIINTKVETVNVMATYNGNSLDTDVTFVENNFITLHANVSGSQSVPADGSTLGEIIVYFINGNGLPVSGQRLDSCQIISGDATLYENDDIDLISDGLGKTGCYVHSDVQGAVTLEATYKGVKRTHTINFVEDSLDFDLGTLTVTRNGSLSNGTSENLIEARILNAQGDVTSGQVVDLSVSGSARIVPSDYMNHHPEYKEINGDQVITTNAGVGHIKVTNKVSEIVTLTATYNNKSKTVNLSFIDDTADLTNGQTSITVTQNNVLADGVQNAQIEVELKNAAGLVSPGEDINVSVSSNTAQLQNSVVTTDSTGKAIIYISNIIDENVTVTLDYNGTNDTRNITFIDDSASLTNGLSTIVVLNDNQPADGATAINVEVTLLNANSNPVPLEAISFSVTGTASLASPTLTTDNAGQVTAQITNTVSESVVLTVNYGSTQSTHTLTFVP